MGLCERFGCLPSQLLAEDGRLLRWLAIESLGREDVATEKPRVDDEDFNPASIPMVTL